MSSMTTVANSSHDDTGMDNSEIMIITILAVTGVTFIILIIYIIYDCCYTKPLYRDVMESRVTERTYLSRAVSEDFSSKTTTLRQVAGEVLTAAHITDTDKKSEVVTTKSIFSADYWPWPHLTDPLTDEVNFSIQNANTLSSYQKILPAIASLESTCNSVAGEFDRCATNVKDIVISSGELPTDVTALVKIQSNQHTLSRYWGSVRRLLYCADVHLRNAALFQKYYFDLKQLQRLVESMRDNETKQLVQDTMRLETVNDLASLASSTKHTLSTLKTWETMQRHLAERSTSLVPVNLRTQPITRRLPLRTLCSYHSDQIQLAEGETVTLISNYNSTTWKVKTIEGVEGEVPAVCLLIPPPDNDAIEAAARLHRYLIDTYDVTRMLLQKRVVIISNNLLGNITTKKGLLSVLTPDHKQQLFSQLDFMEAILQDRCYRYEQYPQIEKYFKAIHQLIESSSHRGMEDGKLERDVLDVCLQLKHLIEDFELLSKRFETLRSLFDGIPLKSISSVDEDDMRSTSTQSGATVTVANGAPKDVLRQSSDERRRTYSIRAVCDPETNEEISLEAAVTRGIIDTEANAYVNKKTGERYPLPVAIAAGFIIVTEAPHSPKQDDQIESGPNVEIIGISLRHDTRPYKIRKVREMGTDRWMSVSEAAREGWINLRTGLYRDLVSGDEMSQDAALDLGLLQVEFPEGTVPTVIRLVRYFAMYGLVDHANNSRILSYNEAFERGLLDRGEGTVQDTGTGRWTTIPEAMLHRWVRAAIIEDVDSFDAVQFLATHNIRD